MLIFLLYILLGALAGHVLVRFARQTPDRTVRIFGDTLAVAAFIYVAFAMASMESVWLAVEIAGLLIFLGFAYLGINRSLTWLWTGWLLHILWDAGVHLAVDASFVPGWYPAACIGFDAVVAYHIYRMQHEADLASAAPA